MFQTRVKTLYEPFRLRRQSLFQWLNKVFNQVDDERRKEVGPDRSCAEWLLRNGAFVKFNTSTDLLTDYNRLPADKSKVHIVEVEAIEASIMHYGFEHFVGCNYIRKIHFHKCYYLENQALKGLQPLKNSLKSLQICECFNITEEGLISLNALTNLTELILIDLPYVKHKNKVISQLQKDLPKCKIEFH